jgi:hypothetical protein
MDVEGKRSWIIKMQEHNPEAINPFSSTKFKRPGALTSHRGASGPLPLTSREFCGGRSGTGAGVSPATDHFTIVPCSSNQAAHYHFLGI